MVQPKYSPEEALQRIKLMMEYDSSKTLTENKKIVSEAPANAPNQVKNTKQVTGNTPEKKANPNILTDNDLLGSTGLLRQIYQTVSDFAAIRVLGISPLNVLVGRRTGVKGVVDALDGFVNADDLAYVLTSIKSLDGKCYYDDVSGTNVPAINRFLELYSEDEGGDDLETDVNGVGTRTLPTGADKIKQKISATISELKSKSCAASSTDDSKNNSGKTNTGKGGGGAKQQTPKIPSELKDTEGVKKFQDWLDKTKPGWAAGFPGGKLSQASGYGRFGPRTTKAWSSYGQEYIKGGSVQPEVTPEVSGEVQNVNVSSADF